MPPSHLIPKHFHHPQKPHTHQQSLSIMPHPQQPLNYFLSLWICLFCAFHVSGTVHNAAFCVWLPSVSIMLSRSIHAVAISEYWYFIPFHCWIKWHCALSPVQLFVTPWTVARQASLSMGFPRQEYWGGMPFPSPGTLPDPGIELKSSALVGRFFSPLSHLGSPKWHCRDIPNFVFPLDTWWEFGLFPLSGYFE